VKELDIFNFGRMSNQEHCAFHESFLALVEKFPGVVAVVETVLGKYRESFGKEKSLVTEINNPNDEFIRAVNRQRMDRFDLFTKLVDLYCSYFSAARNFAAENIKMILSEFADIQDVAYQEKTARFKKLIEKLKGADVAEDVEYLGVRCFISEIRLCNEKFDTLVPESMCKDKYDQYEEVRKCRNDLNRMCQNMVSWVDVVGKDICGECFDTFMGGLKELLTTYRYEIV